MLPYLVLLMLITAATLFDGKRIDKILFCFLATLMLFFSALRVGGTGTGDYDAYLRLYSLTDTFEKVINPTVHAEIGFRFLSLFGHSLGFGEQYIIIAMAVLALVPVAYVIYKYSPYKMLSLLIWMPYFLTMNMHSSRTSVAAAFGLIFIILFYKKKWVMALLCFVIAVSFHSSALILVSVFLARVSLKKLFYILFSTFFVLLFVSPFELVIKIFESVGLGRLSSIMQMYITSGEYGYAMKLYDPRIILGVMIVVLIFYCQKHISKYFDIYYFKLYIIGVLLMITFSDVVIVAWRVSYFVLLIGVIVIPWLAKIYNDLIQQKSGNKRVVSSVFIVLYFLYAMPIILSSEPFKFLF